MKRKILFLNPTSMIGGAEKSLLSLINSLNKEKFEPIIVLPFKGPLTKICKQNKIKFIYLPFSRKFFTSSRENNNVLTILSLPFLIIPLTIKIATIARQNSIEIIHSNGIKMHLISALVPFFCKCKLIWHVRDIMKKGMIRSIFSILTNLFPHFIISNSNATKKALINTFFSKKILKNNSIKYYTIYNSIDPNVFFRSTENNLSLRKELSIPNDHKIITSIGHIVPLKGYHILLKAFIKFYSLYPNFHLLIVGDNIYKTSNSYDIYMKKIKDIALNSAAFNNIHFIGKRNDINNILNISDLAVLASLSEGFGRTNIEALLTKTPIITTNVGGIPEIIKNMVHGILVESNNVNDLFEALLFFIKNQNKMKKLADNGFKMSLSKFSPKKIASNITKIYDLN